MKIEFKKEENILFCNINNETEAIIYVDLSTKIKDAKLIRVKSFSGNIPLNFLWNDADIEPVKIGLWEVDKDQFQQNIIDIMASRFKDFYLFLAGINPNSEISIDIFY